MKINQAAFGRQARIVRILSHLPILVQAQNSRVRRGKKKTQKVYLPMLTVTVRYTDAGDVLIEIEPP